MHHSTLTGKPGGCVGVCWQVHSRGWERTTGSDVSGIPNFRVITVRGTLCDRTTEGADLGRQERSLITKTQVLSPGLTRFGHENFGEIDVLYTQASANVLLHRIPRRHRQRGIVE